jgi:PBSX family phage terminase large subunit
MATTTTTNNKGPLRFGEDHPTQQAFVTSDTRYVAFISGIGAGKTVGGVGRLLRNVSHLNPGHTGYVLAPTVPSLRNVIVPELEKWGVLDRCEYNRTEKRLEFPNDSTVILESADNDRKIERLRGPSVAWFWMDEAATIDRRAWDVMTGRLREGDHLNAFVTTTPKGENWIHELFVDERTRLDDADVVRGIPTHDNPHLPEDYTEEIVEQYEGRFYEQEVLGEFTDFEGLVYPWFSEDNLVDEPPAEYDEVIYGVDWGHNNPAVILAVVRHGDEWTVADEWYERRCTVQDHSRAAEAMVDEYGDGPVYCDPSEPANIEQLERDCLAATAAANDVTPGIQHVAAHADSLLVARRCQNVRNEFNQYQYRDAGAGDRPLKQHDHAMDALRYAIYTHAHRETVTYRSGGGPSMGSFG